MLTICAGCPRLSECIFRCDDQQRCAVGTCGADGFCHSDGNLDHCINACSNGAKDPGESDVDCGGGCAPCASAKSCSASADCRSGLCVDGFCQLASGPPSWRLLPSPT